MRSSRRILPTLALLLALAASAPLTSRRAAAFEYIQNGGFEAGTAGWSTSPEVSFDVVDESAMSPAEGSYSAAVTLQDQASIFSLRQSNGLGVTAGEYRLRATIRMSRPGMDVYLQVAGRDVTQLRVPDSAGQWTAFASTVVFSGNDRVTISVAGRGQPGDIVYIDDVSFEGAPPATMTPTPTPTSTHTPTPTPSRTGTRTPTATKTPSPTRTVTPEATAQSTGSQLLNGGFESLDDGGGPASWEKFGGSLSAATSPVHTGSRAARFASTSDSTKWMHQPVAIQPGDAYAFDAWILQDDPNVSSAFLRISWYASPDGTGAAVGSVDSLARLDAPAPAYRYLTTGAVAAPSEARSARVRVLLAPKSAARAAIYIDDASFGPTTAAPPPPSGLPANDAISPGVASRESSVLDTSRRPRAAAVPEAPVPGVRVVINEVLYDSIGEGSDADGEWVELYNAGDAPAQLAGWALEDNVGSKVLPGFLLGPGGFAVIAASASLLPGIDSVLPLSGRIGNGLGNDGDRVLLRDPSGALVDALSWGSDTSIFDPAADDVPAGHSLERRRPGVDTNAAGDFVDNESPSPGAPLPPHSSGPARESRTGQPIDIIEAEGDSIQPFVLGVIAASAAALVAAVGWRTFPALKSRLRRGV